MCITIVFVVFSPSFWIIVFFVTIASVSVFPSVEHQIIVRDTTKTQNERKEKNIHLNAIFIALSCNIGVNLFGGSMSRVYVCVFKKIL